ncbi:serine/threonine-protein kinase [Petrachloros mirabilis]
MAAIEPGTRVGPFQIINTLPGGQGGMALVYLAASSDARSPDFRVALKITKMATGRGARREEMQDLYFDALSNEVETLRKLKHPNIVRLYPIEIEARITPYIARANDLPGKPWYCVMEYLSGGSLATILENVPGGQLPLPTAAEIVYQIALALDYIHSKTYAHLDVKPDNILFRQSLDSVAPEAVLIDFGIARREKQKGLPAGAASYMAPERIRFVQDPDDVRIKDQRLCDSFSIGVILYRSIAGKLPFARQGKSTTTETVLREEPVPISQYVRGVPPVMEDIIMRCFSKDPGRRPLMPELLAALDEAAPAPRMANAQPALPSVDIQGESPIPARHPDKSAATYRPSTKPRSDASLVFRLNGLVFRLVGVVLLAFLLVFAWWEMGAPQFNMVNLGSTPVPAIISTVTPAGVQPSSTPTFVRPTVTPLPTFTPGP